MPERASKCLLGPPALRPPKVSKKSLGRPKFANQFTEVSRALRARNAEKVSKISTPKPRKASKNQRIAKGASGKGPRQKASKIVKKFFRHFSTFFAQGKKRQKSSKSVKQFFDTFRQISRGTIFPTPFGGLCKKSREQSLRRLPRLFLRLFLRLFGFPGPEALGNINLIINFSRLSAFRARRARETSVRGGLVRNPEFKNTLQTLDSPIRANRFTDSCESPDSRELFQGSRIAPFFLRIAIRGAKTQRTQTY